MRNQLLPPSNASFPCAPSLPLCDSEHHPLSKQCTIALGDDSDRLPTSVTTTDSSTAPPSFKDPRLLGNGERPHFPQLKYLHKTFVLEMIEDVHVYPRTTTNSSARCVLSFPLPIRCLYANGRPQISLMFTEFRAFIVLSTLIATPPVPAALQNTTSAPLARLPTRHSCGVPLIQAIFLRVRRPKPSSHCSSKLIIRETDASEHSPVLGGEGEGAPDGDHSWVRLTFYTSYPTQWLTDDHAILYPYISYV